MTRSKVIGGQIVIVISVNLFKLLLFEQVRFNYNQTWYRGALWEPSHYDALRGHMTRSKVIGGQIVIVILVNLFQILFEQVRFNYNQTWIIGTLSGTMGTFTLWRFPRSHDKVKGHWRSNCYSYGCPFSNCSCMNMFRSDYNQTWIIDALWDPSRYDALRGHMTRSKVIGGQIVIVMVALFKLLLHEQVRSDYNQTWIIGALWEPSRYDALRGHMTRSNVTSGQLH